MTRPMLIVSLAAGILALLASIVVIRSMSAAGQFTTIRPLGGESCRETAGIAGAEDVVIDRASDTAFVSSTDRAAVRRGEAVRGEIYTLDRSASDEEMVFRAATAGTPADFRPDGISLWISPAGERRLFAVNRRRDGGPTVEIFAVGTDGLTHLRTIGDRLFTSPNDVHAVGPDRFYLTNDGGRGPMRMVDFALQRLRSDVVYFDGNAARVAAADFGYANGINSSPDGSTVYVTDTFTRRLRFFRPDERTGALTQTGSLMLGTGLDNIDVDADGALWIAAHPKLMDLALHVEGWSQRAPSQVIRAVPGAGGGGEARTVFLDLGERLSAASVAAAFGDRFLVGSPTDTKMLVCQTGGD